MKKKTRTLRLEEKTSGESWGPIKKHSANYQPPHYIRDGRATGRQVRLNGFPTVFFHGHRTTSGRITFQLNVSGDAIVPSSRWYYVDYDHHKDRNNLNVILHDDQDFRTVSV